MTVMPCKETVMWEFVLHEKYTYNVDVSKYIILHYSNKLQSVQKHLELDDGVATWMCY